jgi:hypothetical protein
MAEAAVRINEVEGKERDIRLQVGELRDLQFAFEWVSEGLMSQEKDVAAGCAVKALAERMFEVVEKLDSMG